MLFLPLLFLLSPFISSHPTTQVSSTKPNSLAKPHSEPRTWTKYGLEWGLSMQPAASGAVNFGRKWTPSFVKSWIPQYLKDSLSLISNPLIREISPHIRGFSSTSKQVPKRVKTQITGEELHTLQASNKMLPKQYDPNLVFRTRSLDGSGDRIIFYNSDKSVKYSYKVLDDKAVPYKLTENEALVHSMKPLIGRSKDLLNGIFKDYAQVGNVDVVNRKVSYANEQGSYSKSHNELKMNANDLQFQVGKSVLENLELQHGVRAKVKYRILSEPHEEGSKQSSVLKGEVTRIKFNGDGNSFKPKDLTDPNNPKPLKLEMKISDKAELETLLSDMSLDRIMVRKDDRDHRVFYLDSRKRDADGIDPLTKQEIRMLEKPSDASLLEFSKKFVLPPTNNIAAAAAVQDSKTLKIKRDLMAALAVGIFAAFAGSASILLAANAKEKEQVVQGL